MVAQRQLTSGGRLPPQPQGPSGFGFAVQDSYGNAALQDELQQGSDPGQMGIQRFESIGESDDEVVVGGNLVDHPDPDADFLYGRVGYDDWSLKYEAGLLDMGGALESDLVQFEGQGGYWHDDDGNWNLGFGSEAVVAGFEHDFWGESGERGDDDGYFKVGGSALTGGAHLRAGAAGAEGDFDLSAFTVGISAGSGQHADSGSDWSAGLSTGFGAGEGGHLTWEDEDQDGIPELGFGGGVSFGPGFGISGSSEVLGGWAQSALEWCGFGGDA